jgi:hypothetical protein
MSTPKPIFDFLTRPENLQVALEVSDYVQKLLEENHQKFWQLANAEVENLLDASPLSEKWAWEKFPLNRLRTTWQKAYLVPKTQVVSASFLRFAIGQASKKSGFRPFYGVSWNKPPDDFEHPRLTKLTGMTVAQGITILEPPRWIRWDYLAPSLTLPENIRRMQEEPETIVKEVIQKFWHTFTILEPEMDAVNRTIREATT